MPVKSTIHHNVTSPDRAHPALPGRTLDGAPRIAKRVVDAAIIDTMKERQRQMVKWGQQDHDSEKWMCILMEEVGEPCKEILEGDERKSRLEATHVAAVALSYIEYLDRESERCAPRKILEQFNA